MTAITVGHKADLSIQYLDQNGNPMLVTPIPDVPPNWGDAPIPAGAAQLVVAADHLSATLNALAAGVDTVGVGVRVGGKDFAASANFSIEAAPQVLTSIALLVAVG